MMHTAPKFTVKVPTMAEMGAIRRAVPKHAMPSKLDRAKANKSADNADKRKLAKWAAAVKRHDEWKDRHTGQPVLKTSDLLPDRAEAHHHEPRSNEDVRYDVRNGITLSFATHEKVEHNELKIVGKHYFTVKGRRYLDVSKHVRFVEVK